MLKIEVSFDMWTNAIGVDQDLEPQPTEPWHYSTDLNVGWLTALQMSVLGDLISDPNHTLQDWDKWIKAEMDNPSEFVTAMWMLAMVGLTLASIGGYKRVKEIEKIRKKRKILGEILEKSVDDIDPDSASF